MQKIYSLFTILSIGLGFSQTILNQSETTSRTVQDPQTVIMLPGFHATSATVNPFVAKIGTTSSEGETPIDSNAGSGNPSGTIGSNSFHDTQGNIEVNGGGQLQFTLPIALPPGVKSVAPQVNLIYTSGSGNGIAGYGWNLSGITSISRMGRTIEKDGEVRGIQLDYSDYYSFNGQRLILKSGEYGKDGAEYVTEKYSNVKIKSVGVISGQQWQGPEYWEVTFEDGSQAWYGATTTGASDARTPIEYNIVKWKDAQGNYISYEYEIPSERISTSPDLQFYITTSINNTSIIKRIYWGGNETLNKPHFNEIIFNYNTRNLKEVSFVNGVKFIQDKLLNNVQVKSNNSQFKKYVINYTENTANYQIVQKITEYNSQDEASNPIEFAYGSSNQNRWDRSPFSDNDNAKITGDFDGDGKIDFIKYFDQFNECTEYDTQTFYDDYTGESYNQDVCIREELRPGGLYLFRGFFDEIKKERLYTGSSDFTKSDFENSAIAISVKGTDNIVKPAQGIALYKKVLNGVGKNDLELQVYSFNNQNQLVKEYTKTITNEMYDSTVEEIYDDGGGYSVNTSIGKLREMDLDGDGISEAILSLNDYSCTRLVELQNPNEPAHLPEYTEECFSRQKYLVINMDNNVPTEKSFSTLTFYPYQNDVLDNSYKAGDFDGDGKMDFLRFDSGKRPFLITFKKDSSTLQFSYSESSFYKNNNALSGLPDRALVGDFNGDRKMDLMVPQGIDSFNWNLYISTGKDFISQNANIPSLFKPDYTQYEESGRVYYYGRHYLLQDLNHDGRSDFIEIGTHSRKNRYDDHNFSSFIINVYENRGITGSDSEITFQKKNIDGHSESVSSTIIAPIFGYKSYPYIYYNGGKTVYASTPANNNKIDTPYNFGVISPLVGSFNINNSNNQILLILKGTMLRFSSYDVNPYLRINKITQGGITTEIDYKELDPNVNPNLYASVKQEQYPYVEFDKVSQSYAVSQLRQTIPVNGINKVRKQDFRYRGFITHLQGKGMIGFRQTARSSWYADGYENTKIWSGAEIDPINEGLPIKEWSIKTNDESQIFPTDISENNAQLLSFKSTQYRVDKLLNGTVVDVGTVSSADKPKLVTAIVPVQSKTKDFQKDITTVNTLEYGSYYLPSKTTSDVNNGFAVSTTELKYIHNISGTGKDYYVGRPESKTELRQVYGDSKGAKEEYTYENNLLKTTKTYNRNNSGWLQDTYLYDGFGNIIEKKTSNSLDSKTKTARTTYEDKGRFVIKKTDVDFNLETHITYNDWGQVLTQTDPLGNTLTNTYDGWGKLLTAKTNLGGTTTYTYEKESNGDTKVTEYSPDGNQKITYTNKIGQKYTSFTKAFGQDQFVVLEVRYDALGRKIKESEPGIAGRNYYQWNTIEYDDYSRPVKAVAFTGKTMETSYSGRTVTITEKNTKQSYTNLPASGVKDKFKTQVADAVGNIISTTDIGGTIEFKYNAAGENTEAKYGTNVVTTKYDSWGRKIEFNDPSNGLYQYEYNDGFGNLTKEISPKGYKEYTFNNLGQLITQREVSNDGTSTNKTIQFEYNTKGAIVKKYGTANGKSYSSYVNYDKYGRVISSGEESNGKYYMKKGITYDDKSRVISYEKSLVSSGILTKTTIENVYSTWSGELYQLKDQTSGKILWQLDEANVKGQILKAKLGGTSIENTYDYNNFLSSVSHINTATNTTVLQLGYSFNAVRNELNSRTRGGDFNINEVFAYDDNNRLVNWTNPVTGQLSNNIYDAQGRIIENDQLGVIKYEDPVKIYQATGMTLNAAGTNNYNNNLIQRVSYNENNDPIYIDGEKGDVAFEYGLTEMRQMVHYGGNFQQPTGNQASTTSKYTKYYSEDGSYEIIRNNQTGEEKHLIYIGGTPYESNIVYLKNFSEAQTKYVFLHKDYLGSILAISDEAGNALEQRHYDAWGNFTHLKIGVNAVITDNQQLSTINLLIDRGYTSHEHFNEVGIIHMNGRLYDPLLRRFLNADENIQDPHNTQNYNKYGYVMNNPLMYNDPNGEFFVFLGLGVLFWKAVIIGAVVGLASYTIGLAVTGNLYQWNLGGALKSMFWGAVSGAVTFGIGDLFNVGSVVKAVGNAKFLVQGMAHGVAQGVLSVMQGGNFWSGAAAGFLGHLGAKAWGGTMKGLGLEKFAQNAGGQILFGALSGGVGAELSGGNFWQGAVTGGIVAGLNSVMHEIDGPGDDKKKALEFKKEYENNRDQQMADTILSEALGETTTPGKVLEIARKSLVKVYGNDDNKSVNRVYSKIVDKLKIYRKSLSPINNKAYNEVIGRAMLLLEVDAIELEIRNQYLLYRIKRLDFGVYKMIFPEYRTSSFGGGGAKGNW